VKPIFRAIILISGDNFPELFSLIFFRDEEEKNRPTALLQKKSLQKVLQEQMTFSSVGNEEKTDQLIIKAILDFEIQFFSQKELHALTNIFFNNKSFQNV